MKMRISFPEILLCAATVFSAENYSQWNYYRPLTVNTSSTGAGVSATQTNFPLLVRLNSSNFNFAQAMGNGADVRFSKSNGTHLPYQIESWDSLNQSAAMWVLMDTVFGNNAAQSFRMYYGKIGSVDSSKGSAVFDTANGFQGVFHLAEATNDTARDATANRFKGIPRNVGGQNPQDTTGIIGKAKNFLGSNINVNGGSYRIVTSSGANSFTNNALNFQNDSATRAGLPLYTISTWINVSQFPDAYIRNKGILSKTRGKSGPPIGNNQQFQLILMVPAIDNIYSPLGDSNRVSFTDGPFAEYKDFPTTRQNGPSNFLPNKWFYLTAIRSGNVGSASSLRICLNFKCFDGNTSTTTTIRSDYDVYVGSLSNDSGFFNGKLDEIRFENVARDTNWTKLSYETQKPASSVVSVGSGTSAATAPVITVNPLNLIVPLGGSNAGKFWVVATGTTPFTYKWIRTRTSGTDTLTNTGIFTGTTTDTLRFTNATIADSGSSFKCRVSNVAGSAVSNSATLSLRTTGILGHYVVRVKGAGLYSFRIPDGISSVRLSAEDVMGHIVWNRNFDVPKNRTLSWNGSGMDGQPVSPGMYVVRMKPKQP